MAVAPPAPELANPELADGLSPHLSGEHGARYEIRGELARGGMGVVLQVWDARLRRELAMKVARTKGSEHRDERRTLRFLDEAQITGQLQHPGILPVHDLGLAEGHRPYFTMPRVRGIEFSKVLRRARAGEDGWTLQRALGVLVKVCETLAFAHSRGVLHRDLKPANVMVGAFGETYVMDWGLARVRGVEDRRDLRPRPPAVTTERSSGASTPVVTMDGDVLGTPAYMPPEQASGKARELDERADLYAVGAMLYHLLTGCAPYTDGDAGGGKPTPHAVLLALRAGPPRDVAELAPETPPELADVCRKAMERDPASRYGSALDLARDLEAFLGSRPVAAHEAGFAYALTLAYRRNRALWLTAAAALALLLAGGLLYLLGIQREQRRTQRLADSARAELLVAGAGALHPGMPGVSPRLDAWVEEADRILARRARDGAADDPLQAGAAEALQRLAALAPELNERARAARELPRTTLEEPARDWERARAAIAASPRYGGLELRPQLGLVPLREDPASGLWEFWLPLSGERPRVDEATGRYALEPATGVVLVLCPGGVLADDGDERSSADRIEPLFAGKYEVTLAQWQRLMDPGHISFAARMRDLEVGGLHPVETVAWGQAMELAARLGCQLPTEPQWEHLARAGHGGLWSWVEDPARLPRFANLGDQAARDVFYSPEQKAPWDDSFPIHAPVGSFEPSPFGLHDVLGNVTEWCRSGWRPTEPPEGPGGRPAFRGASWYHGPGMAHFEFREAMAAEAADFTRGLRLVRALDDVREPD